MPLALVALLLATAAGTEPALLAPPAALEQMRRGELLLVDVRSFQEWQATGLAEGAVPISIHQSERTFRDAVLARAGGDRARAVALICAAGVRSSRASRILEAAGFTRIYDVAEGMEGGAAGPGWRSRGLPLVPLSSLTGG